MLKIYDKIIVKKTGNEGSIIEIDDDNGTKPPIYLIVLTVKSSDANLNDVVFWCDADEIK